MRSWCLSLVLLSAVSLHICLSQSPGRDIQDDKRIIEAVKRYNREQNAKYLYRPLTDVPPTLLEVTEDSRTLGIRIKETVCPKYARRDLLKCGYKKSGKVRSCTLVMSEKDGDNITCQIWADTPGFTSIVVVGKLDRDRQYK